MAGRPCRWRAPAERSCTASEVGLRITSLDAFDLRFPTLRSLD